MRPRIRPYFITFLGCPGRCVFCAQEHQTGTSARSLDSLTEQLRALDAMLASALESGETPFELAFFGGTFTALPGVWPERFLSLAADYRERGLITGVRCSTRPDAVDAGRLAALASLGLTTVELGIQSFDDTALAASGRGYTGAIALQACAAVRQAGLGLGVQLLPGMPGVGASTFRQDIEQTAALRPDAARLYPCLVLEGTGLAQRWRSGEYRPWTLDRAVGRLSRALLRLWGEGIPVIRTGLAPEPGMIDAILAGPWHPALGFLARSRALHLHLRRILRSRDGRPGGLPVTLFEVPRRLIADLWGHRRCYQPALAHLSITPDMVRPVEGETFAIY